MFKTFSHHLPPYYPYTPTPKYDILKRIISAKSLIFCKTNHFFVESTQRWLAYGKINSKVRKEASHEIEAISEKEKLFDAVVINHCRICLYSADYYAAFDDGAVYTGIFPVE